MPPPSTAESIRLPQQKPVIYLGRFTLPYTAENPDQQAAATTTATRQTSRLPSTEARPGHANHKNVCDNGRQPVCPPLRRCTDECRPKLRPTTAGTPCPTLRRPYFPGRQTGISTPADNLPPSTEAGLENSPRAAMSIPAGSHCPLLRRSHRQGNNGHTPTPGGKPSALHCGENVLVACAGLRPPGRPSRLPSTADPIS